MTASSRDSYAIAFSIMASVFLATTSARGQEDPKPTEPARATAAGRNQRGNSGAARPSAPVLERSLGWSGGVLAVGAIVLIASRKFARPLNLTNDSPDAHARLCSRLQLTPRQAVHVIRVGPRTIVIGTGPQGSPVTLAQWSNETAEPGQNATESTEFPAIQDLTNYLTGEDPVEVPNRNDPESPASSREAAA